MASFSITGDITVAQDIGAGETGNVTQNATLTNLAANAIFDSAFADSASIFNAGSILSVSSAISLSGANVSVINIGSMSGRSNVINLDASGNNGATIVNHGNLNGLAPGADGIFINGGGVNITNTGTIFGHNDDGIQVATGAGSLTNRIDNSGVITSTSTFIASEGAITTGSNIDLVTNSGIINGNVRVSGNQDVLTNSGTINGNVFLESENDIYRGFGGTVNGIINGGADNDTFFIDQADAVIDGGSGDDTVFARSDVLDATGIEEIRLLGAGDFAAQGDADTALILGNSGNNVIIGSSNAGTINGRGGNDEIIGGSGNDTLVGGSGNDEIFGGADDDLIIGGVGDDTITGGLGRDILRGQQGSDTFVYNDETEMGFGAGRDVINGFNRGADVIDVSGINDESFAFIGTSAFSGSGAMELRYIVVGGVNVVVQVDENGDGVTDGELNLRGLTVVDAGDFVL